MTDFDELHGKVMEGLKAMKSAKAKCSFCREVKLIGNIAQGYSSPLGYCYCPLTFCRDCQQMGAALMADHMHTVHPCNSGEG